MIESTCIGLVEEIRIGVHVINLGDEHHHGRVLVIQRLDQSQNPRRFADPSIITGDLVSN